VVAQDAVGHIPDRCRVRMVVNMKDTGAGLVPAHIKKKNTDQDQKQGMRRFDLFKD